MATDKILNIDEHTSAKIKYGRPNKNNIYKNEQKEILDRVLNLLGLNENNNIFYIQDIEADKSKVEQIIALVNDVKKYFPSSGWCYFVKKNLPHPWFSLVRSILKVSGYKLTSASLKNNHTRLVIKTGLLVS